MSLLTPHLPVVSLKDHSLSSYPSSSRLSSGPAVLLVDQPLTYYCPLRPSPQLSLNDQLSLFWTSCLSYLPATDPVMPSQALPPRAFSPITNLYSLDLHDCRISNVSIAAFHGLESLRLLRLSGNALGNLPSAQVTSNHQYINNIDQKHILSFFS